MSENKEQVKPLAPAAHRLFSDDNDAVFQPDSKKQRHRTYVQCCGCVAALMLILAVIMLVLIFTIFRIKDPKIKMNSVKISGLGSTNLSNNNITVTADVSIKNPNAAAFKFGNATTTTVYYGGVAVGEGRNPAGVAAAARRTLRLNVTVELEVGKLLGVERFGRDLRVGELNVSICTRVGGRVKILGLFKKNVDVKMNCTMSVNVASQEIGHQSCWQGVSI